ncbi:MAG: hypothetical protein AB7S75_10100 [Desulfococcaceae bacterium]
MTDNPGWGLQKNNLYNFSNPNAEGFQALSVWNRLFLYKSLLYFKSDLIRCKGKCQGMKTVKPSEKDFCGYLDTVKFFAGQKGSDQNCGNKKRKGGGTFHTDFFNL